MGVLADVGRILKPPKKEDLFNAPREFQQELRKGQMNNMDVILLDRDFKAGDVCNGIISRVGKLPMVTLKVPEPMAFFKIGTFLNRTTGRNTMIAVEGYPYGLELDRALEEEEMNATANETIKKGEHFKVPILIDRLPYYLLKSKTDEVLKNLMKEDYFELTPSLLESLGHAKLARDITDDSNGAVIVTLLIGCLVGAVGAFAWVAGMGGY